MPVKQQPKLSVLSHAEVIRRVQKACDALVAAVTENHEPPVSCRAGCAHCCKQPVFITPLEGVAIRDYVEAKGLRADVERSIARYRERVDARPNVRAGFIALHKNVLGLGPAPTERQRRAVYGIDCPFLKGGRCRIYSVRPLMCREHISFDDPAKCARDEPFLGLDKPRFSEVTSYLTMETVPPKGRMLPVYEFDRAASLAENAPLVRAIDLKKVLRWKTGR